MRFRSARREFLSSFGAMTAAIAIPSIRRYTFLNSPLDPPVDFSHFDTSLAKTPTDSVKASFRIVVINDEISQDFGRAYEVAAREFGMDWIELRGMWNKNVLKLDSKEVNEARRILEKNKLRVTDIASPLFKVDWPGAPKSKHSPKRDEFNADFSFEH
jgi:hypothetical protein